MPNYDEANGVVHEHCTTEIPELSSSWISDPTQLIHWQVELVNSCEAIHNQLTQIKRELKVESEQTLRIFGCASAVST